DARGDRRRGAPCTRARPRRAPDRGALGPGAGRQAQRRPRARADAGGRPADSARSGRRASSARRSHRLELDGPRDASVPAAAGDRGAGRRSGAGLPGPRALSDASKSNHEAVASARAPAAVTASYEASPEEVGRVLLLYSGGLDTSVMLKWIQDQYAAEIVALTVDLGQPGEDFEVVKAKALRLGALDCLVVDAREEFAHDYVLPAIKANALYGGGYPLFTALGRPLLAKIAVDVARETGCDTIAHGCTGKGNDQVRIEATIAALGPELKVIAPVRDWRMGREEEVAYAREHGIPIKGGIETPPYSIDDNIWGRSSEGGAIEDLNEAPRRDVFNLITPPEEAPDEPEEVELEFER